MGSESTTSAPTHRRWARHAPLAAVTLVFFVSRFLLWQEFRLRFDEFGIDFACQTLDLELLRHDLLRSVFYLHHQVPLFNLVIGVLFKCFPEQHLEAFAVVYVSLGYGLAISVLSVLRSLGVGPFMRTIATVVFCISPAVVTYEWWASYHQLGAPLLGMSLAALCLFLHGEGSRKWGHVCFTLVALTTLARSVYGLPWMAAIIAILLLYRPVSRRLVLRVSAIPLILVFLITIKTPLQTGRSFGHALTWPNIALKVLKKLPSGTADKLFAEGKLSQYSKHDPFFVPSTVPALRIKLPKTNIAALDHELKSNGQSNANCLQHVYFGDAYKKDAVFLLTHYPGAYVQSVWESISNDYLLEATNVAYVNNLKPYKATAAVRKPWMKMLMEKDGRVWGLTIGLPLSLLYGILWLLGPRAQLTSSRTRTPVIAVIVLTVLNATATTLVSWGDFSRYRFDVDSYFFVLFILLVGSSWTRIRRGVSLLSLTYRQLNHVVHRL